MDIEKEIAAHFSKGHETYLQHLSIDCVVFGFHEGELKVLLLKTKIPKKWALPGGYVLKEESLDSAAYRILHERTGLQNIFLEQFYAFGDPERAGKKFTQPYYKNLGIHNNTGWMFERFISIGYSALVDFTKVSPEPDLFSDSCEWYRTNRLPELIFDHRQILQKGLQNLRMQLSNHPVGHKLLPAKFTMPELQRLYETILDKKLDRRNFQRKILAAGILKKLDETRKGSAHRAPFYYKFDLKKYKSALKAGMGFDS